MKAVILAGGLGTKMGKAIYTVPKPMLEIAGKSVLFHKLEALIKDGISEFILVTGYLGEKNKDCFGDASRFGVKISYYREAEPLGMADALFRLGLTEYYLLCNAGIDIIFP